MHWEVKLQDFCQNFDLSRKADFDKFFSELPEEEKRDALWSMIAKAGAHYKSSSGPPAAKSQHQQSSPLSRFPPSSLGATPVTTPTASSLTPKNRGSSQGTPIPCIIRAVPARSGRDADANSQQENRSRRTSAHLFPQNNSRRTSILSARGDGGSTQGGSPTSPFRVASFTKYMSVQSNSPADEEIGSGDENAGDHLFGRKVSTHDRRQTTVFNAEGYEVVNGYTIIDQIGSGMHGRVLLAVNTLTNAPFALKAIPLRRMRIGLGRRLTTNSVQEEIAIMKKLTHKNIVKLHEVINDEEDETMYLVLDYAPKGPVVRLVEKEDGTMQCNKLDPLQVVSYAKHIAEGLRYLHGLKVVHCDVKPDNLLLADDDTVLISDFGVSEDRAMAGGQSMTTRGTPLFLAPELWNTEEQQTPSSASDMWAFGVTLYAMMFGSVPFARPTLKETGEAILNDEIPFPRGAPPVWVDAIKRLLERDPKKRITAKEFLSHGFFADISVDLNESPHQTDVPVISVEESRSAVSKRNDARLVFYTTGKLAPGLGGPFAGSHALSASAANDPGQQGDEGEEQYEKEEKEKGDDGKQEEEEKEERESGQQQQQQCGSPGVPRYTVTFAK